MKKFVLILFLICFALCPCVYADNEDPPASGDLWDSFSKPDNNYKEEKAVSDEDFEKALEQMKKKQDPIGTLIKKFRTQKGSEQSQGDESEALNTEVEPANNVPVICLPVDILLGEGILPVGHYQVIGERKNDGVVLKFYQAQYLMAEIPATETNDDFEEETISFAKWRTQDDETIKLIYGSMDFNAFAYLKIKY